MERIESLVELARNRTPVTVNCIKKSLDLVMPVELAHDTGPVLFKRFVHGCDWKNVGATVFGADIILTDQMQFVFLIPGVTREKHSPPDLLKSKTDLR